MSDLLIQNVRVLEITESDILIHERQDILISGNRIENIQSTGQVDTSHFKQVIEGNGQLAMPSLMNTHAHVPMALFRGLAEDVDIVQWFNEMWQLEANLQPEDVYWGMMLGIAEMIEGGITYVAEHYWHMHHAAKAIEESGIRGLLGWAMFGEHGREAIEKTGDFVKQWHGQADGRITTILAPHAPYTCPDDFLRLVVQKAEELDTGIHIHVSENAAQREASLESHGKTPVKVIEDVGVFSRPTILAHICGATDADLDIIAKYRSGVAHAPKTYLKLGMDFAPVTDIRARGIPVGLATDPVSNNTLDILESMRLMPMMQKQRHLNPEILTLHDTLTIATKESAKVVFQEDNLGELKAGMLADLILIDMSGLHHHPLHNIPASVIYHARATDIQTTICDGQVLMHNRKLLTIDKAEVIAQAHSSMSRLSKKVPGARIQTYQG